jgi:2-methylcitrate dehydratase PrpD
VLALLAGVRTAEGKAARDFFARIEPTPLGSAAGNAAAMRLTEIDDIHRPTAVTVTAIVLPAVLAMGAHAKAAPPVAASPNAAPPNAAGFLDALFAGQEVAIRVARALGGARLLDKGIWPSYAVAPVGAAAAAGRMLGLDADRMRHALALALSQTPRIVGKSPGARPGRWPLFGNAVRSGCVAALAAADGIDGDTTILNAGWLQSMGAPQATNAPAAGDQATAGAADRRPEEASSAIVDQLSIKPHCSAKQVLAAVHGLRQLVAEGLDPSTIDALEVHVPSAYSAMIDREPPDASRLASMVSARWQLALAALQPALLDDVARGSFPRDPALLALAAKVTIHADSALDALYPRYFAARLVVTAAGRRHETLVQDSPGDPALRYDAAQLKDKAVRILGQGAEVEWVARVLDVQRDAAVLDGLYERFVSPAR